MNILAENTITGPVNTLEVLEERRHCILCRGELIDLPENINIHPVPCQLELDAFVPEKISTKFPDFFHRLTNFKLAPIQEEMFLFLENSPNSYIPARCIGKTTFLLVYIIYKALETGNSFGAVFHSRQMEKMANQMLKQMFLSLTEEERLKLDIHIEINPSGRLRVRQEDPKVDTLFDREIRDMGHPLPFGPFGSETYHINFEQITTRSIMYNRGLWYLIFDPLY